MTLLRVSSLLLLACFGASCSDQTVAPVVLDNSTAHLILGRSVLQLDDTSMNVSWVRAQFMRKEYNDPDRPYELSRISPFAVRSINIDGDTLPLLHRDSLVYGYSANNTISRILAGRHVISVSADSLLTSFAEEITIPSDATISMPAAGDTLSISSGFWVEWDNHGSQAFETRVEVSMDGSLEWIGEPSQDDGNMFMKEFTQASLVGPAQLRVLRFNYQSHWITTEYYANSTASTETVIPVVLVP